MGEIIVYADQVDTSDDSEFPTKDNQKRISSEACLEALSTQGIIRTWADLYSASLLGKYSWTLKIASQVLQTLSILLVNISNPIMKMWLLSNNHISLFIEAPPFHEKQPCPCPKCAGNGESSPPVHINSRVGYEEVLGYYVSLLKTLSLNFGNETLQLFFMRSHIPRALLASPNGSLTISSAPDKEAYRALKNKSISTVGGTSAPFSTLPVPDLQCNNESIASIYHCHQLFILQQLIMAYSDYSVPQDTFPLYSAALKLFTHSDPMTRTTARQIVLHVLAAKDNNLRDWLSRGQYADFPLRIISCFMEKYALVNTIQCALSVLSQLDVFLRKASFVGSIEANTTFAILIQSWRHEHNSISKPESGDRDLVSIEFTRDTLFQIFYKLLQTLPQDYNQEILDILAGDVLTSRSFKKIAEYLATKMKAVWAQCNDELLYLGDIFSIGKRELLEYISLLPKEKKSFEALVDSQRGERDSSPVNQQSNITFLSPPTTRKSATRGSLALSLTPIMDMYLLFIQLSLLPVLLEPFRRAMLAASPRPDAPSCPHIITANSPHLRVTITRAVTSMRSSFDGVNNQSTPLESDVHPPPGDSSSAPQTASKSCENCLLHSKQALDPILALTILSSILQNWTYPSARFAILFALTQSPFHKSHSDASFANSTNQDGDYLQVNKVPTWSPEEVDDFTPTSYLEYFVTLLSSPDYQLASASCSLLLTLHQLASAAVDSFEAVHCSSWASQQTQGHSGDQRSDSRKGITTMKEENILLYVAASVGLLSPSQMRAIFQHSHVFACVVKATIPETTSYTLRVPFSNSLSHHHSLIRHLTKSLTNEEQPPPFRFLSVATSLYQRLTFLPLPVSFFEGYPAASNNKEDTPIRASLKMNSSGASNMTYPLNYAPPLLTPLSRSNRSAMLESAKSIPKSLRNILSHLEGLGDSANIGTLLLAIEEQAEQILYSGDSASAEFASMLVSKQPFPSHIFAGAALPSPNAFSEPAFTPLPRATTTVGFAASPTVEMPPSASVSAPFESPTLFPNITLARCDSVSFVRYRAANELSKLAQKSIIREYTTEAAEFQSIFARIFDRNFYQEMETSDTTSLSTFLDSNNSCTCTVRTLNSLLSGPLRDVLLRILGLDIDDASKLLSRQLPRCLCFHSGKPDEEIHLIQYFATVQFFLEASGSSDSSVFHNSTSQSEKSPCLPDTCSCSSCSNFSPSHALEVQPSPSAHPSSTTSSTSSTRGSNVYSTPMKAGRPTVPSVQAIRNDLFSPTPHSPGVSAPPGVYTIPSYAVPLLLLTQPFPVSTLSTSIESYRYLIPSPPPYHHIPGEYSDNYAPKNYNTTVSTFSDDVASVDQISPSSVSPTSLYKGGPHPRYTESVTLSSLAKGDSYLLLNAGEDCPLLSSLMHPEFDSQYFPLHFLAQNTDKDSKESAKDALISGDDIVDHVEREVSKGLSTRKHNYSASPLQDFPLLSSLFYNTTRTSNTVRTHSWLFSPYHRSDAGILPALANFVKQKARQMYTLRSLVRTTVAQDALAPLRILAYAMYSPPPSSPAPTEVSALPISRTLSSLLAVPDPSNNDKTDGKEGGDTSDSKDGIPSNRASMDLTPSSDSSVPTQGSQQQNSDSYSTSPGHLLCTARVFDALVPPTASEAYWCEDPLLFALARPLDSLRPHQVFSLSNLPWTPVAILPLTLPSSNPLPPAPIFPLMTYLPRDAEADQVEKAEKKGYAHESGTEDKGRGVIAAAQSPVDLARLPADITSNTTENQGSATVEVQQIRADDTGQVTQGTLDNEDADDISVVQPATPTSIQTPIIKKSKKRQRRKKKQGAEPHSPAPPSVSTAVQQSHSPIEEFKALSVQNVPESGISTQESQCADHLNDGTLDSYPQVLSSTLDKEPVVEETAKEMIVDLSLPNADKSQQHPGNRVTHSHSTWSLRLSTIQSSPNHQTSSQEKDLASATAVVYPPNCTSSLTSTSTLESFIGSVYSVSQASLLLSYDRLLQFSPTANILASTEASHPSNSHDDPLFQDSILSTVRGPMDKAPTQQLYQADTSLRLLDSTTPELTRISYYPPGTTLFHIHSSMRNNILSATASVPTTIHDGGVVRVRAFESLRPLFLPQPIATPDFSRLWNYHALLVRYKELQRLEGWKHIPFPTPQEAATSDTTTTMSIHRHQTHPTGSVTSIARNQSLDYIPPVHLMATKDESPISAQSGKEPGIVANEKAPWTKLRRSSVQGVFNKRRASTPKVISDDSQIWGDAPMAVTSTLAAVSLEHSTTPREQTATTTDRKDIETAFYSAPPITQCPPPLHVLSSVNEFESIRMSPSQALSDALYQSELTPRYTSLIIGQSYLVFAEIQSCIPVTSNTQASDVPQVVLHRVRGKAIAVVPLLSSWATIPSLVDSFTDVADLNSPYSPLPHTPGVISTPSSSQLSPLDQILGRLNLQHLRFNPNPHVQRSGIFKSAIKPQTNLDPPISCLVDLRATIREVPDVAADLLPVEPVPLPSPHMQTFSTSSWDTLPAVSRIAKDPDLSPLQRYTSSSELFVYLPEHPLALLMQEQRAFSSIGRNLIHTAEKYGPAYKQEVLLLLNQKSHRQQEKSDEAYRPLSPYDTNDALSKRSIAGMVESMEHIQIPKSNADPTPLVPVAPSIYHMSDAASIDRVGAGIPAEVVFHQGIPSGSPNSDTTTTAHLLSGALPMYRTPFPAQRPLYHPFEGALEEDAELDVPPISPVADNMRISRHSAHVGATLMFPSREIAEEVVSRVAIAREALQTARLNALVDLSSPL